MKPSFCSPLGIFALLATQQWLANSTPVPFKIDDEAVGAMMIPSASLSATLNVGCPLLGNLRYIPIPSDDENVALPGNAYNPTSFNANWTYPVLWADEEYWVKRGVNMSIVPVVSTTEHPEVEHDQL